MKKEIKYFNIDHPCIYYHLVRKSYSLFNFIIYTIEYNKSKQIIKRYLYIKYLTAYLNRRKKNERKWKDLLQTTLVTIMEKLKALSMVSCLEGSLTIAVKCV